MRLVRAPDRAYLDMHGMSFLEMPMVAGEPMPMS
jgi:hypothetical protein